MISYWRWMALAAATILGTCLSNCFCAENPAPTPTTTHPQAEPSPDYVLRPFDLLKVEVFQEPDFAREVRVSQQSTITLPLIGTVNLKGKTIRQAQDLIRQLYDKDYLVNPQININVEEFAKQLVSVIGAVNASGSVLIPPDQPLTLIDAIAGAGGFSRLADRKHVRVTRHEASGKTKSFEVNVDALIQNASSNSWALEKDDVVFVPERVL